MNKKIYIAILFIFFFMYTTVNAQNINSNGFNITLNLNDVKEKIAYLVYDKDELQITDSCNINNNKCNFKGKLNYPAYATISLKGNVKDSIIQYEPFFIENSEITIDGTIDKLLIKGSKAQEEYEDINKILILYKLNYEEALSKIEKAENDTLKVVKIQNDFVIYESEFMNNFNNWIYSHNKSVVSAFIMNELYDVLEYDFNTLDLIQKSFDKSIVNCVYAKNFINSINSIRNLQIGVIAPEIKQKDPNGKIFSLSSLRGKYVLIDFWASWCRPCRGENPNLVKAYNKYKNKGFDILSVSLDNNKVNWKDAIKNDKLNWHHVSDLKDWRNNAAKLYMVKSIPCSFLIYKDGKIVAKNLQGKALLITLEELLH